MTETATVPNRDLAVGQGNMSWWSQADNRRCGWHNLHTIARYVESFRAARVLPLEKRTDASIAALESVRTLATVPWFSAMIVIHGQHVLFEQYAADFHRDHPHSIQSITKTLMHLVIGRLVEGGVVDLSRTVAHYIPEIGSGYAAATVQQVLNMDVVNDYSEDFADPKATYYRHEEAMGWRLPRSPGTEPTEHGFLVRIASEDTTNRTGHTDYKDANTAVLGWLAERAEGRRLRASIADIVDAAGIEGTFHITTDREGTPTVEGGACLSARDLARYFAIFARQGLGVAGEKVGSGSFLAATMSSGVPMRGSYAGMRYSNHLMIADQTVGHSGWGGQYVLADIKTKKVGVYLSVLENQHATDEAGFMRSVIQMLQSVTGAK